MTDTQPTERPERPVEFDRRMLEILVCPVTQDTLEYSAARSELISRGAGLAYPIQGGIPLMLIDEARRIED
ncbi:Trm112 family protein [Citreicella sp. C3M06]|uniref:Trm112 family protein n=1 Tax=Roseobacteraceae TaxID=2854170 RepID=UPI001C09ADEB|nr:MULTISPECIES: Trm112 family protein [Roseobacteraceae]MBU2960968.1 Trm112 family protein [Citreicella sp. C3M06]MDO6584482.1 Trm112 family protein [Salipiger sp. 1_MG-2023]